ncbi:MAG TPA: hypothetical protein PLX30_04645 [Methanothrix sp.]|mgnify:CR=1 FL=1|nr:hypothetical protein [Methanothrix sp.]
MMDRSKDNLESVASEKTIFGESFKVAENGTDGMPFPEEISVSENVSVGGNVSDLDETVASEVVPVSLAAEDVMAMAIESLGGVETYRQVIEGNLTISMTGRSGILFIPLTSVFTDMYLDSKVNLTDPAAGIFMVFTMRSEEEVVIGLEADMALADDALFMDFTVSEEGEAESAEMYMTDDTAYTKIEGVWTQTKISDLEDLSDLNSSMQDFEDLYEWPKKTAEKLRSSEVELMGVEEVEGELCYKLRVVPNTTNSSEVLEDLGGSATPLGDIMPSDPSLSRPSKTDLDMKETVWISTETYLPKRDSVSGYIIEYIPVDEDSDLLMCMKVDMTTEYLDYNQPMEIEVELPEEARKVVLLPFPLERVG